jgi:exodeoxyribonuclease VII large subunit
MLDTQLSGGLRHALAGSRVQAGRTLSRLTPAPLRAGLREGRAHLAGLAARLESVSPEAVLKRGYALVFDAAGHALTSAAAVPPGARLRLKFDDGDVRATADGGKPASRQGSLPL